MVRLDTHKFTCSLYQMRDNVLRQLYHELITLSDPLQRNEVLHAIERECELLGSSDGRRRHPCSTCKKIARMRVHGAQAFLKNFRFPNFPLGTTDIAQSLEESRRLRNTIRTNQ